MDSAYSYGHFPDLETFLGQFPRYPIRGASLYSIFRDIGANNDVNDIRILDIGDQYIIKAVVRKTWKERIHIAIDYDDEVDLLWLQKYSSLCEKDDKELCMCLVSADTIIYQLVGTRLQL